MLRTNLLRCLAVLSILAASTSYGGTISKDGWVVDDSPFISGSACPYDDSALVDITPNVDSQGRPFITLNVVYTGFFTYLDPAIPFASDNCVITVALLEAPCRKIKVNQARWLSSADLLEGAKGLLSVRFTATSAKGTNTQVGRVSEEGEYFGPMFTSTPASLGEHTAGTNLVVEAQTLLTGTSGVLFVSSADTDIVSYRCTCRY